MNGTLCALTAETVIQEKGDSRNHDFLEGVGMWAIMPTVPLHCSDILHEFCRVNLEIPVNLTTE